MVCGTIAEVRRLVAACRKAGTFAFDVETSGLSAYNDDLLGVGLASGLGEGYIPLECEGGLSVQAELESLFGDDKLLAIAHRAYFDKSFLMRRGIKFKCKVADTKAIAYLLEQNGRTGLKYLASMHFGMPRFDMPTSKCSCCGKSRIVHADLLDVGYYCMYDCVETLNLYNYFSDKAATMFNKPLDVLTDLVKPIANLMLHPVKLAPYYVNYLYCNYLRDLRYKKDKVFQVLGEAFGQLEASGDLFNINSNAELAKVLYTEPPLGLGLPVLSTTRSGQPGVDVRAFLNLINASYDKFRTDVDPKPLIKALTSYRKANKLFTTYIEPYQGKKELLTQYDIYRTGTGRLASSHPNLQNVPELMRGAIIAKPGYVFVSADYSQLELRLLAHFSKEPELVAGYNAGTFDLHAEVAKKLNIERRAAKSVNFGIAYGQTEWGLAYNLYGIADKKYVFIARKYIKDYFARFPCIKKFIVGQRAKVKEPGYVTTLLGRRRYFDTTTADRSTYRHYQRAAINTPIQGSGADIINMALVELNKYYGEALRLQIHDELVLEVKEADAESTAARMKVVMEAAGKNLGLLVPLVVDIRISSTWAKKRPVYYERSDKDVKSITDILGKVETGNQENRVHIRDLVDQKGLVITGISGPVDGSFGEFYIVAATLKDKEINFASSHLVIISKLLKIRDKDAFPVKAMITKPAKYYDIG